MELLETQDPDKKRLIETSHRHKHEIAREVKEITGKAEQVLKNALIIGGALALTYLLITQIGGVRKKKKAKKSQSASASPPTEQEEQPVYTPPSFLTQVGERIAAQATVLLLDLAKEKLSEYLSKRSEANENPQ
jgi:hypothetical protein